MSPAEAPRAGQFGLLRQYAEHPGTHPRATDTHNLPVLQPRAACSAVTNSFPGLVEALSYAFRGRDGIVDGEVLAQGPALTNTPDAP